MQKGIITTGKAPKAIGPYSQATSYGDIIFVSGQLPIDMETGELVTSDIGQSLSVILANIEEILSSAGSSLQKTLKVTIFIKDMAMFGELNDEYTKHFTSSYPAREVVEVSRLPKDSNIEVSVIAHK